MKNLTNKFLVFALTFMSLCNLISCKEDKVVGKWPIMEWSYEDLSEGVTVDSKTHLINIPATGSITLVCDNYKLFWLADPYDCEIEYDEDDYQYFSYYYTNEYIELIGERNVLHCNFKDVPEDYTFDITVTAGDIFDYFHFKR